MTKLTIFLNSEENDALRELSNLEYRDPRSQVILIIRQELIRLGFIKTKQAQVNKSINSRGIDGSN